jgi:hypothetical protein
LLFDSDPALEELDSLDRETEQLARTQPEPGTGQDHGALAERHRVSEERDLLGRQNLLNG